MSPWPPNPTSHALPGPVGIAAVVPLILAVGIARADVDPGRAVAFGGRVPSGTSAEAVADSAQVWCARACAPEDWRVGRDGFRVESDRTARGRRHVRLRQICDGLPVAGGAACVSFGPAGDAIALGAVQLGLHPGPSGGAARPARAVAMDALGVAAPAWSAREQSWVRRERGVDERVSRVELEGPRPWESAVVWVADGEGSVREIEHATCPAVALAYPEDGDDALVEVPLERLLGDGTRLLGQWVEARDGDGRTPYAADGDFRVEPVEPDTTTFDEGNVYVHADRFVVDHVRPLGFEGFPTPLQVRVRSGVWPPYTAITAGSVVYLAAAQEFFFRDPAKARDLLAHEISHTVTLARGVVPTGAHREPASLHEALADYHAAAWTRDPAVGEWVYFRFPAGATRVDGPADVWRWEHYDSLGFGPNLPRSQWANGMILSAALWDLRQRTGRAADSLALEALDEVPAEPLWADYANALLAADGAWHAGRYGPTIVETFAARGILGTVASSIEGPAEARPNAAVTWRATSVAQALLGRREWWVLRECRDAPCPEGWVFAGTGDTITLTVDLDHRVRLITVSRFGLADTTERAVSVMPPRARIVGPATVPQNTVATWIVDAVAMGDLTVSWWRDRRIWGGTREPLGGGSSVTLTADTNFVLEAYVRDRLYRGVSLTQDVTTVVPVVKPGPPLRTGLLRLLVRVLPGAREADLTIERTRPGPARVRVYDVTGRFVRSFELEAGVVGVQVVRVPVLELPTGLHLMRLDTDEGSRLRKIAIVR